MWSSFQNVFYSAPKVVARRHTLTCLQVFVFIHFSQKLYKLQIIDIMNQLIIIKNLSTCHLVSRHSQLVIHSMTRSLFFLTDLHADMYERLVDRVNKNVYAVKEVKGC